VTPNAGWLSDHRFGVIRLLGSRCRSEDRFHATNFLDARQRLMQVSAPTDNDRELVARVAAGDERALADLYDRFGGMVYSLAVAILRDAGEAEEATADAFLQVWNGAGSFDADRGSVAAWLTMMGLTRSLDRLRSRGRREKTIERATERDEHGVAIPVAGAGESGDTRVENAELRETIRRHMSELPENQRSVIDLAFFRGLTHSEIASELGEPLGTVKTRIRAAMEKLRTALAPYVVTS
jgi:RNA polymerase sigma-70 factor (ECF subfamily)